MSALIKTLQAICEFTSVKFNLPSICTDESHLRLALIKLAIFDMVTEPSSLHLRDGANVTITIKQTEAEFV